MQNVTPAAIAALVMELVPAAAFALAAERIARGVHRWPATPRFSFPALCALPYVAVSVSQHIFRCRWFALYAALPVAIAWLFEQAAVADPQQRGNWRDAIILL